MRSRVGLLIVGVILVTQVAVVAAEPPIAVSPGSATGARIGDTCPTFSWGGSEGAKSYELVVYRVGEDGKEAREVLRQRFPGSVNGWTPSLDSCFERGGRYAWSVRALAKEEASQWSAPSLFEVAAGLSELEFEAALEVVREHLDVGPQGADSVAGRATMASPTVATSEAASAPTPRSHEGTGSSIIVDGVPVETKADPPCYPSEGDPDEDHRFIDCGNGTVLDTTTGLLWLEWANCRSCFPPVFPCPVEDGERNWYEANAFASNLRDGECQLSDHSQRRDWRLPTVEEWDAILRPDCDDDPKIFGRTAGCYAAPDNGWATEVVEVGGYWASGTLENIPVFAYGVSLGDGLSGFQVKSQFLFAWPVRGGQ